jgi:hypothetical protein
MAFTKHSPAAEHPHSDLIVLNSHTSLTIFRKLPGQFVLSSPRYLAITFNQVTSL